MAGNCRHPGTFTVPGQDGADRVTSPNQLTDPPGLHPAARILGDRGRRVIARHRARRTGAIRRIPRASGSAWMHRATFDLVWLGVLILTPGVGVPTGPVCPAFPLRFRLGLSAGGRVRPVGVVPGWPGTAGTRPAPTASAAEGASGGGGRSGPAEPGC